MAAHWRAVIAATVCLTVACGIAYVLAPAVAPCEQSHQTPGLSRIPRDDRIVALGRDGTLTVVDARDATAHPVPCFVARLDGNVAPVLSSDGERAYLTRPNVEGAVGGRVPQIVAVSLRTGRGTGIADGRLPAAGVVHHPRLAATTPVDRVVQVAYLAAGNPAELAVYDTVTGHTESHPLPLDLPAEGVSALVWDPFANTVYLVAGDRFAAITLDDMSGAASATGVSRTNGEWLDISPFGDSWLVVEGDGSATRLLTADIESPRSGTPMDFGVAGRIIGIDASPDLTSLAVIDADGRLYRMGRSDGSAAVVARDVATVAW